MAQKTAECKVDRTLLRFLHSHTDHMLAVMDRLPDDAFLPDTKTRIRDAASGHTKSKDALPDIYRLERLIPWQSCGANLEHTRDMRLMRQHVQACRQTIESELCVTLQKIAAFAARPVCNGNPCHAAIAIIGNMTLQLESPGWQAAPMVADMVNLAVSVCELERSLTDSQYATAMYPAAKDDVAYAAFLLKALTGQY